MNRIELETEEVKALKDHPGITPVDFTDGSYYNFKRSQIIAPGVRMLPAPGHTYGNSIVIVEDGELFYMIHGDLSYTDEAIYADKLSLMRRPENIFVPYADMYMIPQSMTAWPLRIFRMTGNARNASSRRISLARLKRCNRSLLTGDKRHFAEKTYEN